MKRVLLLILAILLPLAAGGCLKANTVDERGYVLAIGYDPGETFAYRITFAVQNNRNSVRNPANPERMDSRFFPPKRKISFRP